MTPRAIAQLVQPGAESRVQHGEQLMTQGGGGRIRRVSTVEVLARDVVVTSSGGIEESENGSSWCVSPQCVLRRRGRLGCCGRCLHGRYLRPHAGRPPHDEHTGADQTRASQQSPHCETAAAKCVPAGRVNHLRFFVQCISRPRYLGGIRASGGWRVGAIPAGGALSPAGVTCPGTPITRPARS